MAGAHSRSSRGSGPGWWRAPANRTRLTAGRHRAASRTGPLAWLIHQLRLPGRPVLLGVAVAALLTPLAAFALDRLDIPVIAPTHGPTMVGSLSGDPAAHGFALVAVVDPTT
jgi:hypothetical protein